MIWKMLANIISFFDKCKRDKINAYSAQAAFFMILSAIPFLMLFSSLIQYTPITEGMILQIVNQAMPQYIAPFVISIINEVYTKSFGIVSVAAVAAIWSAAKGVQYLTDGLNVVNDIEETRSWFVLRFWAIIYTIVFALVIILVLICLVFGHSLQDLIIRYVPLMEYVMDIIMKLRVLVLLVIMIVLFLVVFTLIPNRKTTFRSQLPGAIICALSWYLFSWGFSVYVNYFNGFSMYGSLTTIVLIMLWMYFCMMSMLMSAEFNVVFDEYIEKWHQKKKKAKKS